MDINIPIKVRNIIDQLEKNGFEAYIVGGCVRDALMGITPRDFDITTSALPSQIQECFKDYKIIETGLKHGTLTIVLEDEQFEVTTYRIDGEYLNHRSPEKVSFTNCLAHDLSRRDFTINAMAYSDRTGIIDKYGGQKDLFNRKIRCVGEPAVRFSEDALRILRALRFSASLDFEVEDITSLAIHECSYLLESISVERIRNEFNLILTGDTPGGVLLKYSDVLVKFIPEIKPCIGFNQHSRFHIYDVWEHTVNAVVNSKNDLIIRLALFFHDIAKPQCFKLDEEGEGHFYGHERLSATMAETILKRLKYDNETIQKVCMLIAYHYITPVDDVKVVRRLISRLGEAGFHNLLEVMKGDSLAKQSFCIERLQTLDAMKLKGYEIINRKDCLTLQDLKVDGHDIASYGVKGPIIGAVLDDLLSGVIDGDIENTREALLAVAKKTLTKEEEWQGFTPKIAETAPQVPDEEAETNNSDKQ